MSESGGFFGKVKGLIFEEDSPPKEVAKPVVLQDQSKTVGFANKSSASELSGDKFKQIFNHVETVSLSRKTAYTALLEAANKLKAAIPDETMRLNAAYAIVEGEQRTVQQMLQAIDVHLQDVDGEKLKFISGANNHQNTSIGKVDSDLNNLNQSNLSANQNIQSLEREIESYKSQIVDNIAKIGAASESRATMVSEFANVNLIFDKAVETVKQKLTSQRTLIQSTFSK